MFCMMNEVNLNLYLTLKPRSYMTQQNCSIFFNEDIKRNISVSHNTELSEYVYDFCSAQ